MSGETCPFVLAPLVHDPSSALTGTSFGNILSNNDKNYIVKFSLESTFSQQVQYQLKIQTVMYMRYSPCFALIGDVFSEGDSLRVAMEKHGESLFAAKVGLSEAQKSEIMLQLHYTILALHAKRYYHGDLALRNILIDAGINPQRRTHYWELSGNTYKTEQIVVILIDFTPRSDLTIEQGQADDLDKLQEILEELFGAGTDLKDSYETLKTMDQLDDAVVWNISKEADLCLKYAVRYTNVSTFPNLFENIVTTPQDNLKITQVRIRDKKHAYMVVELTGSESPKKYIPWPNTDEELVSFSGEITSYEAEPRPPFEFGAGGPGPVPRPFARPPGPPAAQPPRPPYGGPPRGPPAARPPATGPPVPPDGGPPRGRQPPRQRNVGPPESSSPPPNLTPEEALIADFERGMNAFMSKQRALRKHKKLFKNLYKDFTPEGDEI
jgi:hypothetical protein